MVGSHHHRRNCTRKAENHCSRLTTTLSLCLQPLHGGQKLTGPAARRIVGGHSKDHLQALHIEKMGGLQLFRRAGLGQQEGPNESNDKIKTSDCRSLAVQLRLWRYSRHEQEGAMCNHVSQRSGGGAACAKCQQPGG